MMKEYSYRPYDITFRPREEDLDACGGYDPLDWEWGQQDDSNLPSYDKGGHKLRSLAHSANHYNHWKKR